MSVKLMTLVFEHSESTLAARLVLLALADRAWDDGLSCYPGLDEVARKAKVDKKTVQRSIKKLVDLGEVVVLEKGTGRRSTRYHVLPKLTGGANCHPSDLEVSEGCSVDNMSTLRGDNLSTQGDSSGDKLSTQGGQVDPSGGASCPRRGGKLSPDPLVSVIEPSENRQGETGVLTNFEFPIKRTKGGSDKWFLPVDFFELLQVHYGRWVKLEEEFAEMKTWLEANREKRKLKNGMKRFIHTWLRRELEGVTKGKRGFSRYGYVGSRQEVSDAMDVEVLRRAFPGLSNGELAGMMEAHPGKGVSELLEIYKVDGSASGDMKEAV